MHVGCLRIDGVNAMTAVDCQLATLVRSLSEDPARRHHHFAPSVHSHSPIRSFGRQQRSPALSASAVILATAATGSEARRASQLTGQKEKKGRSIGDTGA